MKYENREKWKLKSLISWIGTFEYIMLQKKGYTDSLLFAEHGENMLCTKIVLNVRNYFCTQHVLPRFELGIFMYWTCSSMNNLLSYCGLVDAKKGAFYKDLKYIPLEDISSCVFWPFISYPFRACFCLVDKYSREETIKNGKFLYIVSESIYSREESINY